MHLSRIGVDDNFFAAGGHSLLALQAINRSNTAFEARLTLRDLFDEPTIAGLAARIGQFASLRSVAALESVLAVAADAAPVLLRDSRSYGVLTTCAPTAAFLPVATERRRRDWLPAT